jgi:hypothetical protein
LQDLPALKRLDLRNCGAMPEDKQNEYYTTRAEVKAFQKWLKKK